MSTSTALLPFHPNSLVESRLCPLCLIPKPIAEFRPHSVWKGKRHRSPHCNACHAQRERDRKAGLKREVDGKLLHAAWGSLARPETKRLCIERFLMALMKHFGGPQELAKQWHQCFVEATALKRVRAGQALIMLLERFEHHDVDPDGMTDEELASAARNAQVAATIELFQSNPETAAVIAERFGFQHTANSEGTSDATSGKKDLR